MSNPGTCPRCDHPRAAHIGAITGSCVLCGDGHVFSRPGDAASPFGSTSGTYANRGPSEPITLASIEAARRRLVERVPKPLVSDITVSPDLEAAARGLVRAVALIAAPRVHVDTSLPPNTWHEGKPRKATS